MYLERVEYFCPACKCKGIVTDVLINPDLLIVRGSCAACGIHSSYRCIDLAQLTAEYNTITEDPHAIDQTIWSSFKFKIEGGSSS